MGHSRSKFFEVNQIIDSTPKGLCVRATVMMNTNVIKATKEQVIRAFFRGMIDTVAPLT